MIKTDEIRFVPIKEVSLFEKNIFQSSDLVSAMFVEGKESNEFCLIKLET